MRPGPLEVLDRNVELVRARARGFFPHPPAEPSPGEAWVRLDEVDRTGTLRSSERRRVSFGAPAGGAIANEDAVEWHDLPEPMRVTHLTLWDAPEGGRMLWEHSFRRHEGREGYAVEAGDSFSLPAGNLKLAMDGRFTDHAERRLLGLLRA